MDNEEFDLRHSIGLSRLSKLPKQQKSLITVDDYMNDTPALELDDQLLMMNELERLKSVNEHMHVLIEKADRE